MQTEPNFPEIFDDYVWRFDHTRKQRQAVSEDEIKDAWRAGLSAEALAAINDGRVKAIAFGGGYPA